MGLKANWQIVGQPIDPDSTDTLFFTDHEWDTVDAATARIKAFVPILVERDVRARILKHRMTRPQHGATRASASGRSVRH